MEFNLKEKNFNMYLTVLRFIPYKVTSNLCRIYLDIDNKNNVLLLTALYKNNPSDLEIELLDDICTNTDAHLPDYTVEYKTNTINNYLEIKHDYVVYALYEKE